MEVWLTIIFILFLLLFFHTFTGLCPVGQVQWYLVFRGNNKRVHRKPYRDGAHDHDDSYDDHDSYNDYDEYDSYNDEAKDDGYGMPPKH